MNAKNATIVLDSGAEVTIINAGTCKSCGEDIYWCETVNGKRMPVNEDMKTSHFATCKQANQWRKKDGR